MKKTAKPDTPSTLVYSCSTGSVIAQKKPKEASDSLPSDGIVRLRREVKGRGGGTVIVIHGIPLPDDQLKELAAAFKKRCGCGGSVKDRTVIIQGDHRELLSVELRNRGYTVKLSGG